MTAGGHDKKRLMMGVARFCLWVLLTASLLVVSGRPALGAGQIEITAAVDQQTAYIGDLIHYTITITYDSTLSLIPPPVGANLGQFDVKDYDVGEEVKLEDGRRQRQLSFVMRTFTTGEYVIPPLPIEYLLPDSTRQLITADPLKIEIKSLLAEGTSPDSLKLRPLKKQVSLARPRTGLIIASVAAVLLVAAVVGYILWRRHRQTAPAAFVDPRPAWEIAFAELALLREKDFIGKGEIKPFYFELSDIMRRYLAKKFSFAALDMTTEEIDHFLTTNALIESTRIELTAHMEHADLVKFAKYLPPEGRPMQDWQAAYDLVEKTRDVTLAAPSTPAPEMIPPPSSPAAQPEDPELKYVPPELHEHILAQRKGERP